MCGTKSQALEICDQGDQAFSSQGCGDVPEQRSLASVLERGNRTLWPVRNHFVMVLEIFLGKFGGTVTATLEDPSV